MLRSVREEGRVPWLSVAKEGANVVAIRELLETV